MTDRRASADPTLSEKINYLFETVHPKARGPWSHPEVHRATGISIGMLSELRNGKKVNPTMETLQKLAVFFGVDPAYFFSTPKSAEIREQLEQVKGLRALAMSLDASEAELVIARMSTLSSNSLRALAEMVETLRGLEERTKK
ncbi:helix-turn-helix domain-containing protein [Nocardia sp. NPDC057272]|uniref:helix-turn-helix domain-containing protein n=1 Tax=Nocardia sp. NPDC057272 TaxID=3346079 RepID=UPI00363322EA